jgi:hypothetical protein
MNTMASSLVDRVETPSLWGWVALAWGVLGFFMLLVNALYRLTPIAWEAVDGGLLVWWQWIVLAGWVLVMAYAEGYKGFQKRFSPRFAARAMYLAEAPSVGRALLAPFFCMGLFHAKRRVIFAAWGVTVGVIILVIAVRQLAQPWRGIVDAGVVVGLAWGLIACVGYVIQAVRRQPLPSGPEVP